MTTKQHGHYIRSLVTRHNLRASTRQKHTTAWHSVHDSKPRCTLQDDCQALISGSRAFLDFGECLSCLTYILYVFLHDLWKSAVRWGRTEITHRFEAESSSNQRGHMCQGRELQSWLCTRTSHWIIDADFRLLLEVLRYPRKHLNSRMHWSLASHTVSLL